MKKKDGSSRCRSTELQANGLVCLYLGGQRHRNPRCNGRNNPKDAIHRNPYHFMLHMSGARRRKRTDPFLSYRFNAPNQIDRESIETTARTRRLLWAKVSVILRMPDERLPERAMTHDLDGTVKRGRGAKEKDWLLGV